jgi:UTP-glucose-1-phosphate uridylyltransferase
LSIHIEIALAANLEIKLVVNPLITQYVEKLVNNAGYKKVEVISFESRSMTDSLVKAIEKVGDEEVASITMPDTFMDGFTHKELTDLRRIAPSLSLISLSEMQHIKLGQVKISEYDRVMQMKDKSVERISDFAWTGFAIKVGTLRNFPCEDATPGLQLARMVEAEEEIRTIRVSGQYFDCGTINDYWKALGKSLGEKC